MDIFKSETYSDFIKFYLPYLRENENSFKNSFGKYKTAIEKSQKEVNMEVIENHYNINTERYFKWLNDNNYMKFHKKLTYYKLNPFNVIIAYDGENKDILNILSVIIGALLFYYNDYYKCSIEKCKNYIIYVNPFNVPREKPDKIDENDIVGSIRSFKSEGKFNVTSGLTSFNLSIVSRYNEIVKLTIHEVLHWLKVEREDTHMPLDDFFMNKFNFDKKINLVNYETYAEFLASILNIYSYVILKNDGKLETVFKFLVIEVFYSIYQTSKLLKLFGYEKWSDFYKHKNKFYTDTFYFNYTIVRSFYYFNFHEIFKIINDDLSIIPNFENRILDIIKNFIENDKNYQKYINPLFNYDDKSMRYTIIDFFH